MALTGCRGRLGGRSPAVALRGNGCEGLVETIKMVVLDILYGQQEAGVPEPVGRQKTPDQVGRSTCYSTRIWAFSIIFDLVLRCDARPSAVDDGRSRRAEIVWRIQKQPKSLWQLQPCHCGSRGAARVPQPVGTGSHAILLCWPLGEALAEPPQFCPTL